MEDFFSAGGLPAVLKELLPLLHGEALTVNSKSMADNDATTKTSSVLSRCRRPGRAAP
jgi:dihydroxy-acid dehydratase